MNVLAAGPDSKLAVTGTIVAIQKNGFQLEAGRGVGYFNVATSARTSFTNFTPAIGEFVEADGTGSASTSMTASSVKLLSLPSESVTASGQVTSMIIGGFTLSANGKSTSIFPIYSTKYEGEKPTVGEFVSVNGLGSIGSSMVAQSIEQTTGGGAVPSPSPTAAPTASPTAKPKPTEKPTAAPTAKPTAKPTAEPTVAPTPAPTSAPTGSPIAQPATTAFMPSSWGKITAFQVFDDTANGYIPQAAASADGWRYSSVWGARNNIGTAWLNSNANLQTGYYNALETDESSTAWGKVGHPLSWWKANHPDWVLYACTKSGQETTTPAWVPGLDTNVPLDVHNPAVVDYQIRMMAAYAHQMDYHALAIDEATFWQADEGAGSGSYGCGIYQNGSFVRRYAGATDPNWVNDVVAWVKIAHSILTTDPTIAGYHLKLIVNHPANTLNASETAFLANVDADLDETGYIDYGRPNMQSVSSFVMRNNWATYAQQHGVAVLMNANWGNLKIGTPEIDYSVATYLMANQQGESLFAASAKQYGTETWHSQYQANIGAPCGAFFADASSPGVYYRRFANAIAVVNANPSGNQAAHLPAGHAYTDLFGRGVSASMKVAADDGYVLLTSNGCK